MTNIGENLHVEMLILLCTYLDYPCTRLGAEKLIDARH